MTKAHFLNIRIQMDIFLLCKDLGFTKVITRFCQEHKRVKVKLGKVL